jgi:hypothetical protein
LKNIFIDKSIKIYYFEKKMMNGDDPNPNPDPKVDIYSTPEDQGIVPNNKKPPANKRTPSFKVIGGK